MKRALAFAPRGLVAALATLGAVLLASWIDHHTADEDPIPDCDAR